MKRKKIIALLCVAATSASLVTPVMAEENQATGTTQEAAVDQEAPVEEADESNVEQKEESNADVEQSETEKVVSEEKNEPSENITEDTESETSTDETVLDKNLTESLDVDEEVKDGFVEEDGSVYYYEAGKKVTNTIRDFEDESGFEYSCYFDWSGRMMIDSEEWVEYTDENGKSHDGIIRADENGYLIIDDWYQNQDGSWNYYKKDFLRAENEVVEKYGKQYYLDSDGILVTDSQLTIGGQLYQADASGAITLIQASAKEHWVKTNGKWYLFVDNKLVKDKFYLYKGDYYYFDNNGEMQTGSFDTEDGKAYIADSNGIVIYTPTEGWNKTKDGKTWCYYKKDSDGNLYLLRGEFLSYSGSKYYLDWTGVMATGVFEAREDDDDYYYFANNSGEIQQKSDWIHHEGEWYYSKDGKLYADGVKTIGGKKYYFMYNATMLSGYLTETYNDGSETHYMTNDSGVIQETNDWVKYDGEWYFWRDGDILKNGIYDIWGKKYYFNYDGEMQVGRIEVHDSNTLYLTDSSGALINTPEWNTYKNNWYYMNADGSVRKNEFIKYGNDLYYVDSEGKMVTGDFSFNRISYHTDSDGVILKNAWYQKGYDWYYAGEDGASVTHSWKSGAGGVWYYLNESGAMAKGMCWVYNKGDYDNGKYEYFDDNGIWQENNRINKNDWSLVDGKWYYYSEGKPYTGWVGSYYINQGVMCTNTYIEDDDDNNAVYYVDHKGVYQRNSWVKIPGYEGEYRWRYAGTDGKILKNVWVGDYYINGSGYMVSNEIVDTGYYGLCKFADDGKFIGYAKKSDWNKVDDEWYYVDSNGALLKGKQVIGGKTYYFRQWDCVMYANALVYDDVEHEYVFVGSDGTVSKANGWQLGKSGQWYYLENGIPKTGWLNYGGKRYYLSPTTSTGYREVWDEDTGEGEYYFFDQDGAVCEPNDGWFSVKSDGQTYWYYIKNGEPVRNGWYNGHCFYWDGEMITGSIWTGADEIYVYDDNGYLLKNGWHKLYGVWYYTDAKGRAYTGERKINGTKYWFTDEGVWVK